MKLYHSDQTFPQIKQSIPVHNNFLKTSYFPVSPEANGEDKEDSPQMNIP